MDSINVSPMRIEHLEGCMQLWAGANMAHETDMKERVVRLIEVDPNLSRVACVDDSVVGCVLCSYNGFSVYIFRLVGFVADWCVRQGYSATSDRFLSNR